jgi:hypothetical protein
MIPPQWIMFCAAFLRGQDRGYRRLNYLSGLPQFDHAIVSYDDRLLKAANHAGLATVSSRG